MLFYSFFFFFFQAEDGIRDTSVTGVQTCALPIWEPAAPQRDNPQREAPDEAEQQAEADGEAVGEVEPGGERVTSDFPEAAPARPCSVAPVAKAAEDARDGGARGIG